MDWSPTETSDGHVKTNQTKKNMPRVSLWLETVWRLKVWVKRLKNHNRSWNCSYNKLKLEQALVTLHGLLVSSMDILTCKSTHLVFLLMLLILCPFFHSSHAARDTISQGQSITITETIVSADAWCKICTRILSSWKLHISIRGNIIWFKKVSQQTVTWVANRRIQVLHGVQLL